MFLWIILRQDEIFTGQDQNYLQMQLKYRFAINRWMLSYFLKYWNT